MFQMLLSDDISQDYKELDFHIDQVRMPKRFLHSWILARQPDNSRTSDPISCARNDRHIWLQVPVTSEVCSELARICLRKVDEEVDDEMRDKSDDQIEEDILNTMSSGVSETVGKLVESMVELAVGKFSMKIKVKFMKL